MSGGGALDDLQRRAGPEDSLADGGAHEAVEEGHPAVVRAHDPHKALHVLSARRVAQIPNRSTRESTVQATAIASVALAACLDPALAF